MDDDAGQADRNRWLASILAAAGAILVAVLYIGINRHYLRKRG